MAAFGLPGGAEWLVILVVALLLFVPAIVVFGAGYLFGKKSAGQPPGRESEDVSAADRDTMDQLENPVDEPLPDDDDTPNPNGENADG